MYFAILVPTLQQTHTHSDAALALRGIKPHWLAGSWQRLKALASRFTARFTARYASRFTARFAHRFVTTHAQLSAPSRSARAAVVRPRTPSES